jgi:cell shape-determining protein MreD
MAILFKNITFKFINSAPIILLYFFSITELDANFSNLFEILSFNIQIIIVYYWTLRNPSILGNGHIFLSGIINDVIMGLPMGTSALTYLVISLVASYIRNVTVNINLFTDWFTFLIAIFFSNLTFLILLKNFSEISITYTELFYNSFFTFLFYPAFWVLFNQYRYLMSVKDE